MQQKDGLVQITPEISFLPSSRNPFSCDVVFIRTESCTWVYDVGTTSQAADEINRIEGAKKIVLSHFHPDHVMNLLRINYDENDEIFVSKNTRRYVRIGTVVDESLEFPADSEKNAATGTPNHAQKIKIFNFPSSHAKGCLALMYGDYVFLGDGTYAKERLGNHTYNVQLLKAEIELLEALPCKYVCLSHARNFVQRRESLILLHKDIYSRREPNNPEINVENYF